MRRAMVGWLSVVIAFTGITIGRGDEAEDLEKLRKALTTAMAKLDTAANRDMRAYFKSRDIMYKVVDEFVTKLRPKTGVKTYKSPSGDFVLVIGANGASTAEAGAQASASDEEASLVVAIGGDGGPVGNARTGGAGGAAQAQSAKGIAIALAGRGGFGGGGGGGGGAKGKIGSVGFGGAGGASSGVAAEGGAGGGSGISDVSALRNGLTGIKEKSADDQNQKPLKK